MPASPSNGPQKGPTASAQDLAAVPSPEQLRRLLDANKGYVYSEDELVAHYGLRHRTELEALADALETLLDDDQALYIPDEGFTSRETAREGIGMVDYPSARKAFVVVDEEASDIVVAPEDLNTAQHGDKVRVRYLPSWGDRKPQGLILEVLERARTEFVGTLARAGRRWVCKPDMKRVHEEILLPDLSAADGGSQGYQVGDKIVVTITDWGAETGHLQGRITEHLGESGTHNAEMQGILAEFGLPLRYPEEPEAEAEAIDDHISDEEIARRRDMRAVTTFTIDPVNAKDFDDALSIAFLEGGRLEVGIHIADVTHYVREGTALQTEALNRATSVYLVDRVIPMLPERLSNELCSLRPHEDKLTYAAVFVLTPGGEIESEWIGRTVIHSDHRFSYEQAQQILDGEEVPEAAARFSREVRALNEMAHRLREGRFANGAVNFESPEVRFELDSEGKPLGVIVKERRDAHKLIEEFMLLANRQVARYLHKAGGAPAKWPAVYRVHEAPDPAKIADLAMFAQRFGHRLNTRTDNLAMALNELSSRVEGTPEGPLINQYAIRSMQKARYTTQPLGHFGLGYDHYTHFTSPIRRYPDMMVHRLLTRYLEQGGAASAELLEKQSRHSTDREKRASDAERASIRYKQVEFMLERLGEEFNGVVSGLTEWGLYVEITETLCEGMVRLASIQDDHYDYEPDKQRLIGRHKGRIFQFGDKVRVRVADGSLLKRTLDLELADQRPGQGSGQGPGRRGPRPGGRNGAAPRRGR